MLFFISLSCYVTYQNRPEMTPFSSTSMASAAGVLGRPGMVRMSPVRATMNPGSGGDLHLPHRQDEVLRGPQLCGVIGKTVLGLGHAHRQAAEAQLRQAVDLPVGLLGIGHIVAAVDSLGQASSLSRMGRAAS